MKILNSDEADAFAKFLATNPAMKDRWLSWTDQQRAIFMTGMQQFKPQESDSGIAQYMLLAQMRNKPSSTLKDVLEMVQVLSKTRGEGNEGKNMLEAIRLGFDMSAKNSPPDNSPGAIFKEAMKTLKPFYEALSTKDKEMYKQQFEVLRNQIQPLSLQLKDACETANLMGYRKGTGAQQEIWMAIEKMKLEHQRFMAEQGWKQEKWRDKVNFELEKIKKLQKGNFYSQLDLENVKILTLNTSGGMVELHIKIPNATIAKLLMAKIIDSIDVNKLGLNQPENSTSTSEIDS